MRYKLAMKLLAWAAAIEGRALGVPIGSFRRAFLQGLVDELRIQARYLSISSW